MPTGALGQDPARHPILRRWDHKPTVAGTNVLPIVEGTWIELEDGVQVRFAPGGTVPAGRLLADPGTHDHGRRRVAAR